MKQSNRAKRMEGICLCVGSSRKMGFKMLAFLIRFGSVGGVWLLVKIIFSSGWESLPHKRRSRFVEASELCVIYSGVFLGKVQLYLRLFGFCCLHGSRN